MLDSLLATVRADYEDDLPRLILADYFDERGDPRGEFIRNQVAQTYSRSDELMAREAELLAEFEDAWLGYLGDTLYRWWFHRGFLEVSLGIDRFLQDEQLMELPCVAGIHLHPPSYMDTSLVLELAKSPKGRYVRSLYLGFEWVRDAAAIALAESEHLPNVLALDLANNGLTDAAATALSHGLPGLRTLCLGNNLITDEGAMALARSPHRAGLRQLDLSNNEITRTGKSALKTSPHLQELTELQLHGNRTRSHRRRASRVA